MFFNLEPQPYSPRQELQEIGTDPSGGYESERIPFVSSGRPPAVCGQPQNLALHGDGNNFTEENMELCLPQSWPQSTLLWYDEENLRRQQDSDVSYFLCLPEKRIPDQVEPIYQSYSGESDPLSSGQSSPSIFGEFRPSVTDSLPPPYEEAPYDSLISEVHQSTPGISPDTNLDTRHPSR